MKMDYLSEVIEASIWGKPMPTEPQWNKWVHKNLTENHCDECLKIDEWWFLKEKIPKNPHHPYCHCVLVDIPYNDVLTKTTAICPYSKFDPYLFDPNNVYKHGKQKMFHEWGYSIEDSKYLQEEIYRQGLAKYRAGEYELGRLNEQGQRISIKIIIARKDNSEQAKFITGWMVRPDGTITLNTPYGGK